MSEAIKVHLRALWNNHSIKGIELLFDTILLLLRYISISYHLRRILPGADSPNRAVGTYAIDAYCVLQLIVLLTLVLTRFGSFTETIIAGYILFEIYLNLFNILFIGKIREINAPPSSIERSILLLLINVIQVVLCFAIFYHHWLGQSNMDSFFYAMLVLGTIGFPTGAPGWPRLLISLQILLDLVLLLLNLTYFVSQIPHSRKNKETNQT